MRVFSASEFKAKCLSLIDEIVESTYRIVITKRGKPVAELVRYVEVEHGYPQETLRGTARIEGDIENPVVSVTEWNSAEE